jgi:NAD(P)-dependent dehydrogenase (short-subunit alcohol dehydrogenase family)
MGESRVAVVTGASSGIGKELAKALSAQGWRVIGVGRDPARIEKAADEIRATAARGGAIEFIRCDLSLMRESKQLGLRIAQMTDRIDLLANNAGGMTNRLEMTPEGLEASFAANHLGPFLLTQFLLPLLTLTARLSAPGDVRIVMTSSGASESAPPFDFADIQGLATFSPGLAYCSAKLANLMFTRGLAQRLAGTGVVAHAAAPGPVASRFFDYAPEETKAHVSDLAMLSEAEGADTLVWLATAREPRDATGGYWQNRQPRIPHPQAEDPAAVARFWSESEKLIASALIAGHGQG